MYLAPRDVKILRSDEIFGIYEAYETKLGEQFPYFNYVDYKGTDGKCAAQVYLEVLREAVNADKPYRIVSHRYDEFDH